MYLFLQRFAAIWAEAVAVLFWENFWRLHQTLEVPAATSVKEFYSWRRGKVHFILVTVWTFTTLVLFISWRILIYFIFMSQMKTHGFFSCLFKVLKCNVLVWFLKTIIISEMVQINSNIGWLIDSWYHSKIGVFYWPKLLGAGNVASYFREHSSKKFLFILQLTLNRHLTNAFWIQLNGYIKISWKIHEFEFMNLKFHDEVGGILSY